MTNLHICRPGPQREIQCESLGERWCFVCRKRVEFTFTVTVEIEPSYYGPTPSVMCPKRHVDGDLFPGRIREWEEA